MARWAADELVEILGPVRCTASFFYFFFLQTIAGVYVSSSNSKTAQTESVNNQNHLYYLPTQLEVIFKGGLNT